MKTEVALHYSGGTDSTLTAAIVAEQFEKVHLITYKRFGFFSVTSPLTNVKKLRDRFGEDKFTYTMITINKLFKKVSYENFFVNLVKYRFILLSTCGLCKLTMHIRTLIYCLDNNISYICDGANQGMRLFPDQIASVIEEIKKMYTCFGITYFNPVFNYAEPQGIDFADKFHLEGIPGLKEDYGSGYEEKRKKTTGYKLYELGLMPADNVKGTKLDRQMQQRCFQFILFYVWVQWYYLSSHTYEEYEKTTLKFFKDKLETFTELILEYSQKGKKSKLLKLIEN